MRVLCTFPGRYGDLLWALPSIRAVSRRLGQPVDLQIAGEFASLADLLRQQPYLGAVYPDVRWALTPPDEWQAPALEQGYDLVLHLGYHGWPQQPLPFETLHTLNQQLVGKDAVYERSDLALQDPWITIHPHLDADLDREDLVIGFSETHFELKVGLVALLTHRLSLSPFLITHWGTQWAAGWGNHDIHTVVGTWEDAAWYLRNAAVALCCCSALHVLAVAVGTPVILYEPMESRHNPIFLPLGVDGPQVTVVKGHDSRPTTDARHTGDAITAALARQKAIR